MSYHSKNINWESGNLASTHGTLASDIVRVRKHRPQLLLAFIDHLLCAKHCIWHVLSSLMLTATLS